MPAPLRLRPCGKKANVAPGASKATANAKDNKLNLRILTCVRECVRVEERKKEREARSSFCISGACRLLAGGRAASFWRGVCGVFLTRLWAVPLLWAAPRLLGAVVGRAASLWRCAASFAGLSLNKWPVGAVVRFLAAPRPRRGPIGKDLTFHNRPWFRAMSSDREGSDLEAPCFRAFHRGVASLTSV